MPVGIQSVGNSVIRNVRSYFRMLSFLGVLLLSLLQVRRCTMEFNGREFLSHCYQYGPRILPKITVFAAIISSVITWYTINQLTDYQSISYLGSVLSTLLIREVGPLLIAFFVIIYASVSTFDELEDIRLHLHATKYRDFDSYEFVYEEIFPRFGAILLCMPILFFYFSAIAFLAVTFWVNVSEHITLQTFISQLSAASTNHDVIIGLIKIVVFAGVNAFFACFYGMQHEPDPKHRSLPLIKSIYVNLGYLLLTDVVIEAVAIQLNY